MTCLSLFSRKNFDSGMRDIVEGDSRVHCSNVERERRRASPKVEMMKIEKR